MIWVQFMMQYYKVYLDIMAIPLLFIGFHIPQVGYSFSILLGYVSISMIICIYVQILFTQS